MTTYILRDGQGIVDETIQAADLAEARDMARQWAEDGAWDTSSGPVWEDVTIWTVDEDGERDEHVDTVTVQIDPEEFVCSEDEHDWQSPHSIVGGIKENPGVWGNGGGVIITECCMHCGCARVTDTWAQRRDTGEQGLTSVSYERGRFTEALAELAGEDA